MFPGVSTLTTVGFPTAAPFTVRSTSHHTVLSDGETWVKLARDSSDVAAAELGREHAVLAALGVEHSFDPGPPAVLTTPHLGERITEEEYLAGEFLPTLRSYHDKRVAGLPDGGDRVGMIREKVTRRVPEPALAGWCHGILDAADDADLTGDTLCHSDPHPGNWLRTPDGGLVLIDWESAALAAPELDAASVAYSMFTAGRADAGRGLGLLDGLDLQVFSTCLAVKIASGISWVRGAHGLSAARERVELWRSAPSWLVPAPVVSHPWP